MSRSIAERLSAEQLRRAFDDSFAEPVAQTAEASEELLVVRAGESRLALRTRDIAGLLRWQRVTPVPSSCSSLCGLAGIRGTLVAVHSLGALVGNGPVCDGGWIALCASDGSAGLQFDELESYVRVEAATIHESGGAHAVQLAGGQRTVISVPQLLETIRRSAGAGDEHRKA